MENITNIIKDIETLGAVKNSFIFRDNEIVGSTFPGVLSQKLEKIGKLVNMFFSVSKNVGASYDEACIFFDGLWLIVYSVEDNFVVGFLTDSGINIPLLNMTVHSYVPQIIKLTGQPQSLELSPDVKKKMDFLEEEVVPYFGPVARLVFDDCVKKWSIGNDVSYDGLTKLVLLISEEIGDKEKRESFLKKANEVLKKT